MMEGGWINLQHLFHQCQSFQKSGEYSGVQMVIFAEHCATLKILHIDMVKLRMVSEGRDLSIV
jgi:hypothetical protein